jgi:AraC-like DNA-binding protein
MEILILQYALAVLLCLWWIKPFKTITLGNLFKISLFNLVCIFNLVFLGSYILLRELSIREGFTGIYAALFLCVNLLLFLLVPATFLYLRNQFEHKQLKVPDLVHLGPFALYAVCFVIPWAINGRDYLTSVLTDSFFSIYTYCTIGIYLILVMKFLLYKYLPFLSSAKKEKLQPEMATTKKASVIKAVPGTEVMVGSVHLDTAQLSKMDETLRNFFIAHQPYLKRGYNLKQLSEDTSIPLHHLSAFINQYYHIHFNDFINEYRVQYCQVKIKNDEWRSKTLEAIAEESGFNNRNTFTAAFKKVTGSNPSDFLKMVKQQQIA